MAGKRENLDRAILRDGRKAVFGESMQRDLDSSGNIHTASLNSKV